MFSLECFSKIFLMVVMILGPITLTAVLLSIAVLEYLEGSEAWILTAMILLFFVLVLIVMVYLYMPYIHGMIRELSEVCMCEEEA